MRKLLPYLPLLLLPLLLPSFALAQSTGRHALYFDPVIDAADTSSLYSTSVPVNSLGRVVANNTSETLLRLDNDFPRAFSTFTTLNDLLFTAKPWRDSWVQYGNGKPNGSDWVSVEASNSYTLTFAKTAERLIFPVDGLRAGDSIVGMRAIGAYTAASTHTLVVELTSMSASGSALVRQTKTYTLSGADTTITADTTLLFAEEFFTAGIPLYISLVGTTAATTPTITIVGVELLIRQR